MKLKKTVTPAVQQKNQNNSQKSTGPNTQSGKNNSRFNAVKHGLTSRRLMFGEDGKLVDNRMAEVVEALRDHYEANDIVSELLIDNLAVDYWRQQMGLAAEVFYLSNGKWAFNPKGSLPIIQRYNTTNRHALLKNLELLEKLKGASQQSSVGMSGEDDDPLPSAEDDQCTAVQDGSTTANLCTHEIQAPTLDSEELDSKQLDNMIMEEPSAQPADPLEKDSAA